MNNQGPHIPFDNNPANHHLLETIQNYELEKLLRLV